MLEKALGPGDPLWERGTATKGKSTPSFLALRLSQKFGSAYGKAGKRNPPCVRRTQTKTVRLESDALILPVFGLFMFPLELRALTLPRKHVHRVREISN